MDSGPGHVDTGGMAFTSTVVEQDRDVFVIERGNTRTGSVHWEVWWLRAQPAARLPGGYEVLAGWRAPKTSEWGQYGWTYTHLTGGPRVRGQITDAMQRYRNLLARFAERPVEGRVKV